MSNADTRPDTSILEELEYDVPCGVKGCDEKAVVLVTMSHSQLGCPSKGDLLCQRHYEHKIDEMADFLKRVEARGGAAICARCRQHPTGTVSDNLTAVWFR